ncbi:hypothetical protein [Halostella pelagica]|uniref:hypothetical protein n=1 Tax=Halostella pelagica TaxID=2583824 RepID=UPI001080923D|nr:hypothetical protein [Halostella pelagica]
MSDGSDTCRSDIDQRIEEADEIRSGHELYRDDVSLTVTIDHLNEPQAIALMSMFETWKTQAKWGTSRWVSFFVDGDGPFHPEIDLDVDGDVIQSDELKDIAEVETNKFDFDPVTGWFINCALETDGDPR